MNCPQCNSDLKDVPEEGTQNIFFKSICLNCEYESKIKPTANAEIAAKERGYESFDDFAKAVGWLSE